ncbi:thioesterase family protein [Novosphingobium sp. MMS21-SN21R]|uniref:acyl-CoA thioesterase n=1 Tax=Novosphingobium sp. MMS21-SN21R TaxID=2969298 RepID=UPI002885BAFF|nr:thioesterase family protein [Novosphingobium sp. MMS21-SN21R]MDT0509794.1 thioesterase family protein [Novosphingobium sp. MMS21-SN21R]
MREDTPLSRMDRETLDKTVFPVVATIATRFDDVDVQGHINNAAVPVILQEARVEFNKAIDLPALIGTMRPLIAGLTIEYAAELLYPGNVEIGSVVSRIGRTSFTIQQTARQNGQVAIYAETTLVVADENGAAPLPEGLRKNLNRILLGQATQEPHGHV